MIPKKKIDHNPKGSTLEPLGSLVEEYTPRSYVPALRFSGTTWSAPAQGQGSTGPRWGGSVQTRLHTCSGQEADVIEETSYT